jgi:glyoxylase-like metal-dependent hydrolase (beta-lactamase superfamily II)
VETGIGEADKEGSVISRTVGRLCLVVACAAAPAYAEAPAKTKADKVTSRIQWLQTPLANVTMFIAEDGLLIVDSGQPNDASQVAAKIASLSPKPIRYLVDTHYHSDHTGGNVAVARGAKIVAHENCQRTMRKNLKPEQKAEDVGVPQEVYGTERGLRVGKQIVKLRHFGPGHTSGDTVVVFEGEKVIAAGDLFFNGLPPFIDVQDGSDTANWVNMITVLAERYPKYKVIPGHGPVTNMKGWLRFAAYLSALREKVGAAIAAGQSREQAVASIRLDEFPEIKDVGEFLTKAQNVGWVYDELKRAN